MIAAIWDNWTIDASATRSLTAYRFPVVRRLMFDVENGDSASTPCRQRPEVALLKLVAVTLIIGLWS
jgi:hypothetical protein